MISEFEIFSQAGFTEAADIIGQVSCTIEGKPVYGILNEFTAEQVLEIGGIAGTYTATLTGDKRELAHITSPIERTLYGLVITLESRKFKITRCALDSVSFTLGLTNPTKGK